MSKTCEVCERPAVVQDLGSFLDPPGTEHWYCDEHAQNTAAAAPTVESSSGAAAQTVWEREGKSHVAYVTEEAIGCLNRGQTNRGIVNLAHALVVSVEKREPMSEDQVRSYFRQICSAVGEW